ncbi:MAG: hypothetical protein KBA03_01330 [Anaerolineaceae bacterium]|nr:hypothetical protein [Anaerolineaceae bacterium]
MSEYKQNNIDIYKGLQKSYQAMISESQNADLKIYHAQEHFFTQHQELSQEFKDTSRDLLKAALRKYDYATMVCNQLHCLREIREFRVNQYLNEMFVFPEPVENEFPFLDEVLFDQALYLHLSFIDFYMNYLTFFCTGKRLEKVNVSYFYSALKENRNEKSLAIDEYMRTNVVIQDPKNSTLWGDKLRIIRNDSTHKKLLKLDIKDIPSRMGPILKEPMYDGEEVSFFVQTKISNNAFAMLVTLFPILYELDWIPGAYNSNMYK